MFPDTSEVSQGNASGVAARDRDVAFAGIGRTHPVVIPAEVRSTQSRDPSWRSRGGGMGPAQRCALPGWQVV